MPFETWELSDSGYNAECSERNAERVDKMTSRLCMNHLARGRGWNGTTLTLGLEGGGVSWERVGTMPDTRSLTRDAGGNRNSMAMCTCVQERHDVGQRCSSVAKVFVRQADRSRRRRWTHALNFGQS